MNLGMFSSKTPEWSTPQDLYDRLDAKYHFMLDPCATEENAKCQRYFTVKEDGLKQDWGKGPVFMNPPYGRQIGKWVEKAAFEARQGKIVVCLLPARTDTKWFHRFCLVQGRIEFIPGRLYFNDGAGRAPFPSMIVVFDGVS